MTDSHRFELLATAFHMTTGYHAPGKDVPALSYDDTSLGARRVAWDNWIRNNEQINRAWLKIVEVQIEESQE